MDMRDVLAKVLLWWALPTAIAGAVLGAIAPDANLTTSEEIVQAMKMGLFIGGVTMAGKAYIKPSVGDALVSAVAIWITATLSSNLIGGSIAAGVVLAVNGYRGLQEAHKRKSAEESARQAAAAAERKTGNGQQTGGPMSPPSDTAVAFEALVGGRNGVDWRRVHSQEAYARMLEQLGALASSTEPELRARGEIGLAALVDDQFATRGIDMRALVAERLANPVTPTGEDGPYIAPRLGVDTAPNGIREFFRLRRRSSDG